MTPEDADRADFAERIAGDIALARSIDMLRAEATGNKPASLWARFCRRLIG